MGPSRLPLPTEPEKNQTANNIVRVLMLFVVAIVMMWNAMGRVDADMWIPFVCIIAVLGIGTRGAPVETIGFVAAEVIVVIFFGVATFSGSRDFIWAGSLGVSMLAVAKMGYLEVSKRDVDGVAGASKARALPKVPVPEPSASESSTAEPSAAESSAAEPVSYTHLTLPTNREV